MQVTVTFNLNESKANLQKQLNAWNALLAGQGSAPVNEEVELSGDEDAEDAPPAKKTRGKKGKPEATVSDDEDEEFGTKAVDEEELEDDAEESDDDAEEDEDALSWEQVKEAMNKYGNKKPEEMKAILLSFNVKTSKELQQHKNKWEPVYRKTMAKLKTLKKAK